MKTDHKTISENCELAKRTYSAPRLRDYGSVAELTLNGPYSGNDGNETCVGNGGGNENCVDS